MRYMGPFLRINSLTEQNIKNQLFHLSKEAMKHIVLHTGGGLTTSRKDFKIKNLHQSELSLIKGSYPLICIYKKADPKISTDSKLLWDIKKLKKDVLISSNAFMSLALLELSDYYSKFKDLDESKYSHCGLYAKLTKRQLQFYFSYLRDENGVFVDKINITPEDENELKFENKYAEFKFSDQSFLMAAFYKASLYEDKDSEEFKNFSLDILNMFKNYKDELYNLDMDEIIKLALGFNIMYEYYKDEDIKCILLDLLELIQENYEEYTILQKKRNFENQCLCSLNYIMFYKNTGILKFKDLYSSIYESILSLYNEDLSLFIKDTDKDKMVYSAEEINLYIMSLLAYNKFFSEGNSNSESSGNRILLNVFKKQLVESGIILSWPEAPSLDDRERYINFSLNSEDLLDEDNFKMHSIPTPDGIEISPVFLKEIKFSERKGIFKTPKDSFYSEKNMFIFFLYIFLNNHEAF
ncbi:hypothetical protein [Clostridium sp. BSD9I1]|uniref:hypothetical protein n=1 Tax=Clostridium sp. BSD9I1 TaxID=2003589 RepID=UPI0016469E79|nr:hypothetical protein [Clostridium sp. BSD9I1]